MGIVCGRAAGIGGRGAFGCRGAASRRAGAALRRAGVASRRAGAALRRVDAALRRAGASLALVLLAVLSLVAVPRPVRAFGEEGAFNPRVLLVGTARWEGVRTTGPARWSEALISRTSAPAKVLPSTVRADEPALLAEPFAVWGGDRDIAPLTPRELSGLQRFIALGGILFVDDFNPDAGAFGRAARREIARIIPDGSPIPIGEESVVFRSFYLLRRALGRVEGPAKLDAILRGGLPQVLFSSHDLLGALARSPSGIASVAVVPGGEMQREKAIRLAVNIAMYVLCSNYKDDQVHAPFLMRRRGPLKDASPGRPEPPP